MPITGRGWELLIVRKEEQRRDTNGKIRTVGTYHVYHDGKRASGRLMSGIVAETKGPGANSPAKNGKRVEAGRYPLATKAGTKYVTHDYAAGKGYPRPGIELLDTGDRSVLLHPDHDQLIADIIERRLSSSRR